jgi:hypothetical protein
LNPPLNHEIEVNIFFLVRISDFDVPSTRLQRCGLKNFGIALAFSVGRELRRKCNRLGYGDIICFFKSEDVCAVEVDLDCLWSHGDFFVVFSRTGGGGNLLAVSIGRNNLILYDCTWSVWGLRVDWNGMNSINC